MLMYKKVTRDQFAINGDAIIHTPTGAEFTQVLGTDSVIIWTGGIGCMLENGETFRYADVIAMVKTIRRERYPDMPERRVG
jgi:hypothetical protein